MLEGAVEELIAGPSRSGLRGGRDRREDAERGVLDGP
jgi:hypothetical protein